VTLNTVGDSLAFRIVYAGPDQLIHKSYVEMKITDASTPVQKVPIYKDFFPRGALIAMDSREINLGGINRTLPRFDTTFIVRNIGFAPDSVRMLIDPVNVDPVTAVGISPASFFLAPGDSQKVTFAVFPELLLKQYYQVLVTAQPKSGLAQGSLSKSFLFDIVTGVEQDQMQIPTVYSLDPNYPNPFNPTTVISYKLPVACNVKLAVYDLLGREVAVLVNELTMPGNHEVQFDPIGLSSGVYFYRLRAGDFVETKRLVLLR
jgi:hypothetical protein